MYSTVNSKSYIASLLMAHQPLVFMELTKVLDM
jgi:hypothetical protein